MTQKSDGRWEITDYKLVPILSTITADGATQEKIDGFMEAVDTGYLADFGYTKDEVLATNNVQFSTLHDLEYEHTEHNLGDLMSDAYVYAVENSDDFDGVPVDVAVVPSGTVRDTYTAGDITVEQVFNSFSLGIGPDGVPGYPLISVYLTGKELRTAAEIDASVSDYMTTARLYMSGLHFTYNPNRMILNKVTDVYLTDENGLLSLVPKYADGTPIEDFEDVIVMEGDRELKAWDSIARYMQSFEDTDGDGIANVPSYYSQMHDRKVVDESRSLGDLVKSPNKYAAMIIAVILIVIILVVLLIVLVVKLIKRIRRRKADTIHKR